MKKLFYLLPFILCSCGASLGDYGIVTEVHENMHQSRRYRLKIESYMIEPFTVSRFYFYTNKKYVVGDTIFPN